MAKIQTFDMQEKYVGNLSHPDSPGQPVCLDFLGVNRTTTQQLKDCPSETAKRNKLFFTEIIPEIHFSLACKWNKHPICWSIPTTTGRTRVFHINQWSSCPGQRLLTAVCGKQEKKLKIVVGLLVSFRQTCL